MVEPTNGTWKQQGIHIYAEDGGMVCELSEPRAMKYIQHQPLRLGSPDWAEAMANGRLIIAAPDLLEALEQMVAWYSDEHIRRERGLDSVNIAHYQYEADCKARAAVARARGRSEP